MVNLHTKPERIIQDREDAMMDLYEKENKAIIQSPEKTEKKPVKLFPKDLAKRYCDLYS